MKCLTHPIPCEVYTLEARGASTNQELGVVDGAPRELESAKIKRDRYEAVEDECNTHIDRPRKHFQIEDTIERWEGIDVKVEATVAHGVGVGLEAFYLQVP